MPAPALRFADLESLLITALSAVAGISRVVTRLPAGDLLTAALPVIRVHRYGGADDRVTDTGHIDLDTFAATYDDASTLARRAHTAMLGFAHTAISGIGVDTVETISAPTWVDYQNPNLSRFVATYEVTTRVLS